MTPKIESKFDPNSAQNQEIVLRNMILPRTYSFDKLF